MTCLDHRFLILTAAAIAVWTSTPPTTAWELDEPIVTCWSGPMPLTDRAAEEAIAGGHNQVWAYSIAELAIAKRHNLRALLRHDADFTLLTGASLDNPERKAKLDALIATLRAQPADYAYFISDEPSATEFPGLGRIVAYLRAHDPEHLAYIDLFPTYGYDDNHRLGVEGSDVAGAYGEYLRQFMETVKPSLLCYDHYPLGPQGDHREYLLNLQMAAKAAHEAGIPLMTIAQACAWNASFRLPNADELRYLVYSTLAYGARGISYFSYDTLHPNTGGLQPAADGTPTAIYTALTPLNHEFVAIARHFKSLQWLGTFLRGYRPSAMPMGAIPLPDDSAFQVADVPDDMVHRDDDPLKGVLLGLFGAKGAKTSEATFALVQNMDYSAAKKLVVIGPAELSAFNASTGQWTATGTSQTTVDLPPGGGVLMGLTSCVAQLAPPTDETALAAAPPSVPVREKYLLLDDRLVDRCDNARLAVGTVQRHPGNPLLDLELPWETETAHMYANVIFDEEEQIYKCWYFTRIKEWGKDITPAWRHGSEGPYTGICYATSKDGIAWTKPLLDIFRYQGQPTNLVCMHEFEAGVMKDRRESDPSRRYKMFGKCPTKRSHSLDGMEVSFSADGLHWSEGTPCPEIQAIGDTHNNALWVPELDKYVAMTRLWRGDLKKVNERQRLVGRTESSDFIHWTQAVDIGMGTPEEQVYSLPVFPYAGVYLGLPAVYTERGDRRVRSELAWSPDTITWHRIDEGTQFIPLSEDAGSFEWGCIYAAATPLVRDGEIRIYYSGQPASHGWNPGRLCLATLRPDGWAGYVPKDPSKPAVVVTHPITVTHQHLLVNADQNDASLVVDVLDVTGNPVGASEDLSALIGKPVKLRFHLNGGRLYSFSFGDAP